MTVKELRNILNLFNDETEIQIAIETSTDEYIVNAKEIIIGTEPNKTCIYGEMYE